MRCARVWHLRHRQLSAGWGGWSSCCSIAGRRREARTQRQVDAPSEARPRHVNIAERDAVRRRATTRRENEACTAAHQTGGPHREVGSAGWRHGARLRERCSCLRLAHGEQSTRLLPGLGRWRALRTVATTCAPASWPPSDSCAPHTGVPGVTGRGKCRLCALLHSGAVASSRIPSAQVVSQVEGPARARGVHVQPAARRSRRPSHCNTLSCTRLLDVGYTLCRLPTTSNSLGFMLRWGASAVATCVGSKVCALPDGAPPAFRPRCDLRTCCSALELARFCIVAPGASSTDC